MRRMCLTVTLAVAFLLMPSVLTAEKAELGDVHFPISCKAEVQSRFDYSLALLHSFEFREAEEAFRAVETDDPKCVIAAWGIALSTTERSGANAPQKDLAKGWAQHRPWLAIPAGTQREQMYLDAVRAMYAGYDKTSVDDRWHNSTGSTLYVGAPTGTANLLSLILNGSVPNENVCVPPPN